MNGYVISDSCNSRVTLPCSSSPMLLIFKAWPTPQHRPIRVWAANMKHKHIRRDARACVRLAHTRMFKHRQTRTHTHTPTARTHTHARAHTHSCDHHIRAQGANTRVLCPAMPTHSPGCGLSMYVCLSICPSICPCTYVDPFLFLSRCMSALTCSDRIAKMRVRHVQWSLATMKG